MSFNVITITVRGMYSLPPGITSILTASQVQLTPTLEAGGITADGKWKSKRNEIVNNIKSETNEHINTYVHTNSCNKNTISLGARLPWINKQVSEEKRGVGGVTYVCSCCSQRKKERQQTFNKKESATHTHPHFRGLTPKISVIPSHLALLFSPYLSLGTQKQK